MPTIDDGVTFMDEPVEETITEEDVVDVPVDEEINETTNTDIEDEEVKEFRFPRKECVMNEVRGEEPEITVAMEIAGLESMMGVVATPITVQRDTEEDNQ